MKLELDYIREILERIEEETDGMSEQELKVSEKSSHEVRREAYHLRILLDAGFVDGRVNDCSSQSGRAEWIFYKGLTMQGHQTLEAMRDETIWNNIKARVASAGIKGLEKVPGLAVEFLIRGVVG